MQDNTIKNMQDKTKESKKPNAKISKKGRYAEKLNLKMDFNEALKKAVNVDIKKKKV